MNILTRVLRYAVGTRSNGNRRIYIQNIEDLAAINFLPHSRFTVNVTANEIIVSLQETGEKKVIESKLGSSIVELSDKLISKFLGSDTTHVSAHLKENEIRIKIHQSDIQKQKRERSFLRNAINKSFTTASLYSGIGHLTYMMHSGLKRAGFNPKILFANEFDETAARLNANFNPIWENAAKNAVFALDDIQTMDLSILPKYVDHLEIALPCPGMSLLIPAAKRDIKHPVTGKLFIRTLEAISRMNPATLTIECTPALLKSDTFSCIADYLKKNNYSFETTVLKGTDFGDFEVRKRFCLFAVSSGLKSLFPKLEDISSLHQKNKQTFADIKDDVPLNDPSWKEYGHIKKRDTMKSVGYKNVLIGDDANRMPALVAGYNAPKAGSPFIPHPTDPNLQRQITNNEHAKIRKLPKKLAEAINALSLGKLKGQSRTNKTAAHKLCGNSVSPSPWENLMYFMFSGLTSRLKNTQQLVLI